MSARAPSAAVRSAQRSTTRRAPAAPSDQNVASCSRRVEDDLAAVVGHRGPAVREPARRRRARAPRARPGRTGSRSTAGSGASWRELDDVGPQAGVARRRGRSSRARGGRSRRSRRRRCARRRATRSARVDVLADRGARASPRQAGVRHEHVRLVERGDAAQAAHAPLGVVGDDDDPLRRGDRAPGSSPPRAGSAS